MALYNHAMPITATKLELRPAEELHNLQEFAEQGRMRANIAMNFSDRMRIDVKDSDALITLRATVEANLAVANGDLPHVDEWYSFYAKTGKEPSYESRKAHGDWHFAARLWEQMSLRIWVRTRTEFTMEDLPFLLNSRYNPLLNGIGASRMVDAFYKENPSAPRAKNIMGGTYLYGADADCKHKSDPSSWSGVHCLHCPGWFCY